ncbi:MAG: SRPBCC family protein [Flavobacteriaceae bacterium]
MNVFDSKKYTRAPLKIEALIHFHGKSSKEVFEILGDPELITNWFLLAQNVRIHPPNEKGEKTFNVEFTFFGDVFEEILEWIPEKRYVYTAKGLNFPIKDYVACMQVQETEEEKGILSWKIFYSQINGEHYQKIIPVILPPIIEESFNQLCSLIGGTKVKIITH